MAKLPQERVCNLYCPVKGCPDLLPLPVETIVNLGNSSTSRNTITCHVEVIPDASAIWTHLREKHGLAGEMDPVEKETIADGEGGRREIMVDMNPRCGATATAFQEAGGAEVELECAWPREHKPKAIHFDEVMGEWDEDDLATNNPNE